MVRVLWVELPNKMYEEYRTTIQKVNGQTKRGEIRETTMKIIQDWIDRNKVL